MNLLEAFIVAAARWRHSQVEMTPGPVLSANNWVINWAASIQRNEMLTRGLPVLFVALAPREDGGAEVERLKGIEPVKGEPLYARMRDALAPREDELPPRGEKEVWR